MHAKKKIYIDRCTFTHMIRWSFITSCLRCVLTVNVIRSTILFVTDTHKVVGRFHDSTIAMQTKPNQTKLNNIVYIKCMYLLNFQRNTIFHTHSTRSHDQVFHRSSFIRFEPAHLKLYRNFCQTILKTDLIRINYRIDMQCACAINKCATEKTRKFEKNVNCNQKKNKQTHRDNQLIFIYTLMYLPTHGFTASHTHTPYIFIFFLHEIVSLCDQKYYLFR